MTALEPITHALVDAQYHVVDCDDGYARLLGRDRAALTGLDARDLVHPDDREMAARFLRDAWLANAGTVTCRLVRDDATPLMVSIHGSRLATPAGAVLVLTCRPLPQALRPKPDATHSVEAHWQMARLLLHALERGKRAFGETLIANPATEILLLAYLAEAEARAVTAGEIEARTGVSWPLAFRWMQALIESGFAEAELPGPLQPVTPIRLTERATALIEAIFGGLTSGLQDSPVAA